MKPEIDPRLSGSQTERLASIREEARIANARRRHRSNIWSALVIGVFCVAGVAAYLEFSKRLLAEGKQETSETGKGMETEAIATTPSVKPAAAVSAEISAPAPGRAEPDRPDVGQPGGDGAEPVAKADDLAGEAGLTLIGMEAGREAAKRRDGELLGRIIRDGDWDAYRGLLGKSVQAVLPQIPRGEGTNRFAAIWEEPVLDRAMLRWETLGWFPQSALASVALDAAGGDFLRWFLNDPKAMREFLMTIRREDAAGKVLDFLVYAWNANPETFRKYYSLALACAVVFDEPMGISHPLGKSASGGSARVDPVERYLWYVGKNEKGQLAAPVDRSSAPDLIWVVCAPVVTSELEWSLRKMHLRRGKWGGAYGMVEYLMERAVDGVDPYEEYSLAEILKEGGICGDQTYFTINTARAQGIPAIGLSGETSLGGHAWAALKLDDREWDTGVGRISGVSKGQAHNPQTGASITEQEIHLWNDRHHQSPAVTLAVWRHLWLADFFRAYPEGEEEAAAIRVANRIGHSFTETWAGLYGLLKNETQMVGTPPKPGNLEEWKSFASDMRREFKDNPRMARLAAEAEGEYIFPYGSANDAKTAFIRDRRRVLRGAGEQMDLIAGSLKREADLMLKRGDPDALREIGQLYDRALRDYGGNITGFKMMAEDYFGFFRSDPQLARKAARDIELAFKRVVETGTKEWFRAKTETSIYKMICGYYREAGDPKRAELLESRIDVLMRRAKRAAD